MQTSCLRGRAAAAQARGLRQPRVALAGAAGAVHLGARAVAAAAARPPPAAAAAGVGGRRRRLPRPAAAAAGAGAAPQFGSGLEGVAEQAMQELARLDREPGGATREALDTLRLKYGIRRGVDGRAQLRRRDGTWMALKLDMEVTGTVLLRDTNDSSIHVLQTDRLEQLDLSDDNLLFMLFADGSWEELVQPIELGDGEGQTHALTMDELGFKEFVGILKALQEMEEEEEMREAGGRNGSGLPGDGPEIDVTAEPAGSNGR